jgi:hypothetical protein
MNFLVNQGMKQMKGNAEALLPEDVKKEMNDKSDENKKEKENENKSDQEQTNVESSEKGEKVANIKPKKQKKKNPITRTLALKMYTILLFHTLIVTISFFVYKEHSRTLNIVIFIGCFAGGILFSLLVSNYKILSQIFLNYLIYLILLAANVVGFVCLANVEIDDKYEFCKLLKTMFVVFDSGSIIILLFSCCVRDSPSTFWLMCISIGGNLIAIIIMAKIYNDGRKERLKIMFFGAIALAIFQAMNYNAFTAYKKNQTNETSVPSMITLPFELNVCFAKIFWYLIRIVGFFCSLVYACCCASAPKRKR